MGFLRPPPRPSDHWRSGRRWFGCGRISSRRGGAMSDPTDIVRKYFAALSAGDVERAVAFIADDGDFRTPMGPMSGRDAVRAYLAAFEEAFPKATYELDTVITSGRSVVAEGTYRASHQGPLA